ncbi:MAG: hypothetical protein JSS02_25995, partial [Planctomycetes bacterium]|nr:hypothetical protein [Planctomycetota bacterium]
GLLSLLTSLRAANLDFLVAIAPPLDILGMLKKRGGTLVRGVRRGIGYQRLDPQLATQVGRPLVPAHWPQILPGHRLALHAAVYDRFVPRRSIEELARLWNARLTLHQAAHYNLALSTRILPEVSAEICAFAGVD